jgi:hypothetical protein
MRKRFVLLAACFGLTSSAAQAQVDLSTYADAIGYLDVQALTCAQLANAILAIAAALSAPVATRAQQPWTQVGMLACKVKPNIGFIIIALQPVSLEGSAAVNVVLGVSALKLRAVP